MSTIAAPVTPAPMLGGLAVRRTKDIVNPQTRLCCLTYAPPKTGKTQMCATFHNWCMEEYGKPGLYIAFESADGGGVSTVQEYDIPFVQPTDLKSAEAVFRALLTDQTYAAVFVDNLTDMVKNIVQPYALSFPSREHIPTRASGVPERSDYQTMGEKTRTLINMMIALTKTPDPKFRKHLIVNALRTEKRDSNNNLEYIGPDLPGALRETGSAPFELVAAIEIKTRVVADPVDATKKVRQRFYTFVTQSDGVKIAGDRYKVFPIDGPADWQVLMNDYWKPKVLAQQTSKE